VAAASIPVFEDEPLTETSILVRDAIAKVREVAKLDDKVVLPPLPADAPRTARVVFAKNELSFPTPHTLAREAAAANDVDVAASGVVAIAAPGVARAALVDTQRTPRAARTSRWPLVLCALVAVASGTASFLASPIAAKDPSVKRAVASVEQTATATASWLHRALN
jgi:hypothetical protein